MNNSETIVSRIAPGTLLFAGMFGLYFYIGSINFLPLRGLVDFRVTVLASFALAFFFVGALYANVTSYSQKFRIQFENTDPIYFRGLERIGLFVGVISFLSIVYIFRGIPLFTGENRAQIPPILLFGSYGLVIFSIVRGFHGIVNGKKQAIFQAVFVSVLLLLLGYRTLTVLVIGTLFIGGVLLKKIKIKIIHIIYVLIAVLVFSWVAVFRFGAGGQAYLNIMYRLGMQPEYELLTPIWATFREGVGVLNSLMERIPAAIPFANGDMLNSIFMSLLPGDQEGPRLLVARYIGGRAGVTITPSILGQPFVDFGWFGVAIFMFVVGFILQKTYFWQSRNKSWAPKLFYSFILMICISDIHSGILDGPLIILVLFVYILTLFSLNNEEKNRVMIP